MMATNTISTHPRDDSVEIFPNSVALVSPLWLEGRCQASNGEVVAGDLFATPNPIRVRRYSSECTRQPSSLARREAGSTSGLDVSFQANSGHGSPIAAHYFGCE